MRRSHKSASASTRVAELCVAIGVGVPRTEVIDENEDPDVPQ